MKKYILSLEELEQKESRSQRFLRISNSAEPDEPETPDYHTRFYRDIQRMLDRSQEQNTYQKIMAQSSKKQYELPLPSPWMPSPLEVTRMNRFEAMNGISSLSSLKFY